MEKKHNGVLAQRAIEIAKGQVISDRHSSYCPSVWYCHSNAKYVVCMPTENGKFEARCINQRSEVTMRLGEHKTLLGADSELAVIAIGSDDYDRVADGYDLFAQRQESVEAIDISEGMQVVDRQISTVVEISTMVEISVEKAIGWVAASKQYAQIAVICAARAGAEFARIKGQCGHGEWMKVLKLLPVGKETVYKYIKVAEELQARLSEGGDAFDLLQLPDPTRLIEPEYAETLEQINQVTGEQTLRQLYFDWGICKAPGGPAGGYHPGPAKGEATPEQLAKVRRNDANEAVGTLCADIQATCLGERRSIHLADLDHLRLLEGDLVDALRNVRELIKAG